MTPKRHGCRMLLAASCIAVLACNGSPQRSRDVPRFELVESGGCGDILVFKTNTEGSEYLIVDADIEALGLERGRTAAFDLERPTAGIEVWADVYSESPLSPEYCNDFITPEQPIARWIAVGGRASIALGERDADGPRGDHRGTYRATVVLEDLILEDGTGRRTKADSAIEIEAEVGWHAG